MLAQPMLLSELPDLRGQGTANSVTRGLLISLPALDLARGATPTTRGRLGTHQPPPAEPGMTIDTAADNDLDPAQHTLNAAISAADSDRTLEDVTDPGRMAGTGLDTTLAALALAPHTADGRVEDSRTLVTPSYPPRSQ